MTAFPKKVVSLQPQGCENGLRFSNWSKLHCIRLAPSLHAHSPKTKENMETVQLRAELFREMSPMLDSEVMLQKMLTFVKSLFAAEQEAAKQQTLDNIDHSFGQLRQMQEGTLKGIDAEELLNEL